MLAHLLLAALAATPTATPTATATPLSALTGRYLDGLFRAKPHLADYMGDHRFADRLADLSPAGVKRRLGELEEQRRQTAERSRPTSRSTPPSSRTASRSSCSS